MPSDALPRLNLKLRHLRTSVDVIGLVDSGATVCVLPYSIGLRLGFVWSDQKATLRLGGALRNHPGQGVVVRATVSDYPETRLVFVWVRSDDVPLILGHTNFFMEFDVCFFRSADEFEVKPKIGPATQA